MRWLRAGLLIAFEATLTGLPVLALTGLVLPWLGLAGAVGLGWLADGARPPYRRGALALAPFVAAALLGWWSFGLDPVRLMMALWPGQPQSGLVYLVVLTSFFLVWRGTRLAEYDSVTLLAAGSRAALIVGGCLLVAPLFHAGSPLPTDVLLLYVAGLVGAGLGALALTHVIETAANRQQAVDGRWLTLLVVVIGGVLAVGVALVALFSGDVALDGIVAILRALLLPFAQIGSLIVYLLAEVFGGAIRALLGLLGQALARINLLPEPPPTPDSATVNDSAVETVFAVAQQATFVLALIPLALLLIAIMLWRRRARLASNDEERQSLDVAQSLLSDLQGLLNGLRSPFRRQLTGLRAALAALRGGDPSTRVRRAYVQVLLALEARGWRRRVEQTPAEWCATVAPSLPDPAPLVTLTNAYERARYHPAGATLAEAEVAEQAARSFEDL
ncbi:DUF4129 domain-containing protein [Chloroflexus sp.]|uniref:DUF4129 domain-containing protein n=1 Tax=Chloroflexus sp. TaxID=1904827 RepID=UPI00262BE038|nr:DUF4129 domain-containing protein [uncultured Chloroflexus sp.]